MYFIISIASKSLKDFGIPLPLVEDCFITEDNRRSEEEEVEVFRNCFAKCNLEQKAALETFAAASDDTSDRLKIFFLDAPAGSGKTFVLNSFLALERSKGRRTCAVASSGIAATLLRDGRTAHSTFGIPLNVDPGSSSSISFRSQIAKEMIAYNSIVWDEIVMNDKNVVSVVDRFLQRLMESDQPFGGKLIIFAGDFRQVLPIVKKGGRAQIVNQTIRQCPFWDDVQTVRLLINERIRSNPFNKDYHKAESFSSFLMNVGNGNVPSVDGMKDTIQLNDDYIFKGNSNKESYICIYIYIYIYIYINMAMREGELLSELNLGML
jgi:hypothetical protein